MIRVLSAAVLIACLSGCVLGPRYQRPQTAVPTQFRGATAGPPAESIADRRWTQLFQDETLQQLVTTALEHNFDVRVAAERVLEARAQYGITRAGLLPTLDGSAQFTAARSSSVGSTTFIAPGTDLSSSYTQAGLQFSWELDLWGRVRRLTEAARAQYLATDEARHGVIVSLISDVMTTYFSLRNKIGTQISRRNRDAAQDNLRLIQLRKIGGTPARSM